MINVRVLEMRIAEGILEGRALENAKATLEKIDHRTTRVDKWVLENNEGTYGTEIVITREGHIDLYLCIMEKYASRISYIRVGNFQPEFSLGDVQLANGKEKEYQKLGNIINALNKEYEKYGFYFDSNAKKNRMILEESRAIYDIYQDEIKEVAVEEVVEVEEVEEKITFDIDGEGALFLTEKKDVDYATAQKEYRLRLQHAPEQTYNKTDFNLKINGEDVYGFRVDLCKGNDHKFNLSEELLRNLRFQQRVWKGEEYTWMQGEYREKRIKEQFGTEEEMIKFFDKIEKILVGLDAPEPTPEPEKKSGFEVRIVNTSTGEVVETMNAPTMRMAEKIEGGVLINLNKDDYYVEIVDLEQSKITIEKAENKMEEKEMKALNKNALNNRMVKLGEFLKENKDVDVVENKVFELFPNAMEVEVFNNDNVVYFLVGQDYAGKAPTKKEMTELDYNFKEVDRMYGLSIHISVDTDKIEMTASVGVDYTDRYGHSQYTDYTIKEDVIELELTMEIAKELTEGIRNRHDNKRITATYAGNAVRDLLERIVTDEVTDFLLDEIAYYAEKEKEEKEESNVQKIDMVINRTHYLFAEGTLPVSKAIEKIRGLYRYCHNEELTHTVDTVLAMYEKAEDSIWREVVRKQVIEIMEKKCKASVQEKVEKLEKAVTGRITVEDAKEILGDFAKNLKVDWNNDVFGFCVVTEPMRSICFGVGNEDEIDYEYEKIIGTRNLQYGIEWVKASDTMVVFTKGTLSYINDGEKFLDECHYVFHKQINCTPEPEPEKDELDKLIEEYNEVSSEIDALQLNQSVGEDCSKAIKNKNEKLMKLQQKIQSTGDVFVVNYSHRCFMSVPDGVMIFRTEKEVEKFEKDTENILEIQNVRAIKKKELNLDSNEESGDAPEKDGEESELRKQIKDHMNAVLDLSTRENNGVGFMYKKTIAVKKESGYELTTMFEDMWTGMPVYIGNSGNLVFITNSNKCFLTEKIEHLLNNKLGINDCALQIEEKIKRKFEYTYSKSVSVIEEQKVFVLSYAGDMEVFWSYDDAYEKMVKLAKETADEWSYGHKLVIKDYSATVDVFKWTIVEKNVQ